MHNQNFDLFQHLEAVDPEATVSKVVQGAGRQSKSSNNSFETARAGDLLTLADVHERWHFNERDIERQMLRASEPHKWLPFKVLETEDGFGLVDGAVLIQAICLIDPDTPVPITIVKREHALKIRDENFAERSAREPMAQARRALILRDNGLTYEQIGRDLRILGGREVCKSRVSQLIKAAETELQWAELFSAISNPAEVSPRFWEALATKLDRLRKKSAREDGIDRCSDLAQFEKQIRETLVTLEDAGQKVSYLELADKLALANCGKGKPRARPLGQTIAVPGTDFSIGFAPDRKGGAAITLPPKLAQDEVLYVQKAVIEVLEAIAAARAPKLRPE